MKHLRLAILLLSVSALFSCQKEIGFDDPVTGGTGGGSYLPLTAGTYWKYKDTASGALSTQTVTSVTKSISGRTHTAAVITPGGNGSADTVWYAATSPDYFMYVAGNGMSTGAPAAILFHYLKDDQPVGATWTASAGAANGFPATSMSKILEKGISMTVEGHNYTDVIHSSLNLSYNILGQTVSMGDYEYYVAKGVGIIRIISSVTFNGQVIMAQRNDLVEYHIQ